MISQLNVEVSLPVDNSVNPAVLWAEMETCPGVPPVVALENRITLAAVHAVVATIIEPGDPDMFPETPVDAFKPVAMSNLFPIVAKLKLPFVAVIFPRVAVMLVPDVKDVVVVNDPGAVIAAGKDNVTAPAVVEEVIWLAVPVTESTSPPALTPSTHVADSVPPTLDNVIRNHTPLAGHNHCWPNGNPTSVVVGALESKCTYCGPWPIVELNPMPYKFWLVGKVIILLCVKFKI
jgi:hypothetical protein